MIIDYLASLFQTHQIMTVVATLFIINLGITGFEVVLDLLTKKERRWDIDDMGQDVWHI